MTLTSLIVCQAGVDVGLGHLTRSLAAFDALQGAGGRVSLLVQGDDIERPDLLAYPHRIIGMREPLGPAVKEALMEIDPTVVLFDLSAPHVPERVDLLLDDLRHDGRKIVSIDALRDQRHKLDLLYLPAFMSPLPPPELGEAPVIFGWDSFLLRGSSRCESWTTGNRVLALTGGSDTAGLCRTLPTLLDRRLDSRAEIHWVRGPNAGQPVIPSPSRHSIVTHDAPAGLCQLMSEAHYAVTVFGVSFFELLRAGVPTVVFSPYGRKDDEELSALVPENVAVIARNERDAVDKLQRLMADESAAAALSARACQRMAGSGGQRLATAVAALAV